VNRNEQFGVIMEVDDKSNLRLNCPMVGAPERKQIFLANLLKSGNVLKNDASFYK